MNTHELRTVRQEAQRFMKDATITPAKDASDMVRIELPFTNYKNEPIYLYVIKRPGHTKFTLVRYIESTGVRPTNHSLAILQPVLRTFGLVITEGALMMEDSKLPLHQRIRNITQALIGIDALIRLRKNSIGEIDATESKDIESVSNSPNISSS